MTLPALGSVTLSKSRSDASAILTATMQTAAADTYFLRLSIALGDPVRLLDDEGNEVFLGSIHTLERTPEQVSLVAYDRGVYLTRNELYGVFSGTPAAIAAQVAGKLGISVGEIYAPAGRKVILSRAGQSAYQILRQAVGEGRYIGITDGKLTVTKPYNVYPIRPETVLEVRSEADLSGMVNRCAVVGRNGNLLAQAETGAEIAAYGQFQQVLGKNGDAAQQAQGALVGKALGAKLTMLGDLAYRCGEAVELHRPDWGVDGVYAVTASEHCWEAGLFTTSLTLEWIR